MSHLAERLDDWAGWFIYNKDRLPLYYNEHADILRIRYGFFLTLIDGMFEVYALIIEQLQQAWFLRTGEVMPGTIARDLQQHVTWFYQHKDTIVDKDIQAEFLMQSHAKLLQTLKAITEELGALPSPALVGEEDADDG